MADEAYKKELEAYFANVPFWQHVGSVIEELGEEGSLISMEVQPYHLNGNDTVHGGVYATLCDNAMGLASRYLAGRYQATMQMNVHFMAAVSEGKIYARGTVAHRTGKTVTTEAQVTTEDGKLLAMATGMFRILRPKQE